MTYQEKVEHYLDGLEFVSTGACPGCPDCLDCDNPEDPLDNWHDLASEAHFSWSSCECCGSSLGGDRHPAHGVITEGELKGTIVHVEVCTDCLFYINYGDIPEGRDY